MSRHVIDDMNSVPEVCKRHNKSMYWYGDWFCSECQEEEEAYEHQAEANWYTASAKCQQCAYIDDPYGNCEHYKMPISMVKRKKKCKHFKEYIPTDEDFHWDDYDWEDDLFILREFFEGFDKLFRGLWHRR